MDKVLIIGYGSIGKRHAENLKKIGCTPVVLTKYPDDGADINFISEVDGSSSFNYCVIASPTARHLTDLKTAMKAGCRKILIEKPIERNFQKAEEIALLAREKNLDISVAYNLRFLKCFDIIKKAVKENLSGIRLVKICAGQYLPQWRKTDYSESYSAKRSEGGGVDLDLSHELDYMLWLFGLPEGTDYVKSSRLSTLKIDSPDYFKGIYKYLNFIVDVELDYFRKKERSLRIIGENRNILHADFINNILCVDEENVNTGELFNFEKSYIDELKDFLGAVKSDRLTSVNEAINIIKLIQPDK